MSHQFKSKIMPWLFLLPTFIVLALFLYYPMIATIETSLHRTAFMGARRIYVGLENFINLLQSQSFWHSFRITIMFSFLVVGLTMPIAFLMSVLANQKIMGGRLFRTALIWPYALSPAIAGTIWLFIFNPTIGILNFVLGELFGIRPDWISSRNFAFLMVVITAVWKQLGYNIVFFLAGLQNVPGHMIDAAKIDGANPIQRYIKIIIPIMSPTIFFLFTMNLIYAFFTTFGMINVMTQGGPIDATNILIYNLYRDAFQYDSLGLGAAQSLILFAIVTVLMVFQFKFAGGKVHYAK